MDEKGKIGDMNKQVSFMMPIKSRNSTTGEEIKTFLTSSAIWAQMDYKIAGSKEKEKTGKKIEITKVIFTMFFNEAVRPTWRVKHNSREFEILNVLPGHNEMFMRLECQSVSLWRNEYYLSPTDGFWTDPFGNYWVAIDRGETQPIYGNLTWEDGDGNSFITE